MKNLFLLIGLLPALFLSCKKVKTEPDAEKKFMLFVVDTNEVALNYCFDRIYADGRSDIYSCTNGTEGIKLPLSILKDSCKFYFVSGKRKDSITFHYKRGRRLGQNEYETVFDLKKIHSTFDSLQTICIKDLTPVCHGNSSSFSAVIYIK